MWVKQQGQDTLRLKFNPKGLRAGTIVPNLAIDL